MQGNIENWLRIGSLYINIESNKFYYGCYVGLGNCECYELPLGYNQCLVGMAEADFIAIGYRRYSFPCVGKLRFEGYEDDGSFTESYWVALNKLTLTPKADELSGLLLISKALTMAAEGHVHQRRKSDDTPYLNHLIEGMSLLVSVAKVNEPRVLCAALLHDSLEDTNITQSAISEAFGLETLEMINALTDDKSLSLGKRRKHILDKLPSATDNIRRIKLADLCSNASAIPAIWDAQRLNDYFLWLDQVAELCRASSEALYQEYLVRRANSTP